MQARKQKKTQDQGQCKSDVPPVPQALTCNVIEEPKTQTEAEKAKADFLDTLTRRYMWATIIGIIGGLIGVVALICQVAIARMSSEQQLRAYVVMVSGNITNIAAPLQAYRGEVIKPTGAEITNTAVGPVARVIIKNTGQTPAFNVRHWGDRCFRERPLKSDLPPLEIADSAPYSVLGPDVISTKTRHLEEPLTETQIAALRNGIAAIYFHGEIRYRDAFKVDRPTQYRLFHNSSTGPIGVTTDISFADQGNEAT